MLELGGFVLIVVAAAMVAVEFGLFIGGVGLLVASVAYRPREEDDHAGSQPPVMP